MIYPFKCEHCGLDREVQASITTGPPKRVKCACGKAMARVWVVPHIDTSNCRDHSEVRPEARVSRGLHNLGERGAAREEARFQEHIKQRREELKDGNKGSLRHTHSVPADLYHGKIRESGDKDYWSDPSNLNKHKDCKVD